MDGIELTEEQQQEYRELKEQADKETAEDRAALSQEQTVLSGKESEVDALRELVGDMQAQKTTLEDESETVRSSSCAFPWCVPADREGKLAHVGVQAAAKRRETKAALKAQQAVEAELRGKVEDHRNNNRRATATRETLTRELADLDTRVAAATCAHCCPSLFW